MRIYQRRDGKLVEYTRGIDPQSLQRERPPRPGANKFTTRVLTAGTYYVWVDACQPEYQLRTKLFDVPPYLKPERGRPKPSPAAIAAAARKAIRTAMDFQLLAGDSWHANTPRKGHPTDRVANFHHETSTCVACHPTHFTTQSALAAVKAGYEVEQPFALQFLTERLANNPVPFHGHPEAVWARMIPAPANVLGRLSTIVMDFENVVAGVRRDNLHRGIAEFLKLYYDGRTDAAPDETNGNNQVSRYKVAADSWRQLDEIFRRTGRCPLCGHPRPRGHAHPDRQARPHPRPGRPDDRPVPDRPKVGQARRQDPGQCPAVALAPARRTATGRSSSTRPTRSPRCRRAKACMPWPSPGCKPEQAAVRRGIVALLSRQQAFGGWFDLNPYEQFRTPFRETQWALIALSRLYPNPKPRPKGWNGPLGPQPAIAASRIARDADPRPGADLGRARRRSRAALIAQLGHESPLVRHRRLPGAGTGRAMRRRSPVWPDAWATRARSCAGPRPRRCD